MIKKNWMNFLKFNGLLIGGLFTALCWGQVNPVSENYPSKPIKIVVPFSAGSGSDILARAIGERLSNSWSQPVIIENRPGAGGTIATAAVAKSEPDGYTLIVVSAGHVVNPAIYKNLSYDTLKDVVGVAPLANLPSVLVIPSFAQEKNLKEFVALAKQQSGKMNFVSGGIGSASHMSAEKFGLSAQIQAQHIPLKGAPEMAVEIASGRANYGFMPIVAAIPSIKSGKLKALAVSTEQRSSALPDVPSIAEAGEPGGLFNFWIGMLAPGKTPKPIIQKLNQEVNRILRTPEMKERFMTIGAESLIMSPEEFDLYMASDLKTLGAVIKAANVKLD